MDWMDILKMASGFMAMVVTFIGGIYAAKQGGTVPPVVVPPVVPDSPEIAALKAEIAALKVALAAALAAAK